ncbi:MAG: M28 family peptidase [Gemmataceae bacterium]
MMRTIGLGLGLAVLAALGAYLVLGTARPTVANPEPTEAAPMPTQDKFGEARGAGGVPGVKPIPFDAERSIKYLKQIIECGPRVSGSEGMKQQQELLTKHFTALGGTIERQSFEGKQASRKHPTPMTNFIVKWFPDRERRVLLSAHYDTRPMAHEEPDQRDWNRKFDSANDGTSGVAMLMELGHAMKDFPITAFGVDFVFFDAEEYIFEPRGAFGGGDNFFIGSEYFANEYRKSVATRKFRYEAGLLFDLHAHKDAVYRVEGHSFAMAPKLCEQFWQVAKAAQVPSFRYEKGPEVLDDHLALNRANIPTIDIIDFDGYRPHWHRLSDTADKISGPQMAECVKAVVAWLQLIR